MPSHPKLAAEFVKNKDRAHWHDQSLWFVRSKRARTGFKNQNVYGLASA